MQVFMSLPVFTFYKLKSLAFYNVTTKKLIIYKEWQLTVFFLRPLHYKSCFRGDKRFITQQDFTKEIVSREERMSFFI